MRPTSILAIFLVASLSIMGVYGVLQRERIVATSGITVENRNMDIAVYSDAACTIVLTQLNWGTHYAYEVISNTFYVKNTGNLAGTVSASIRNIVPASLAISPNFQIVPATIGVGEVSAVTVSFTIPSGYVGAYSFDIAVLGSG